MFSLKRHFVTEHENVLSVRYVNPPKDIKSSYFRKVTAVNWCNVLWLMVEDEGMYVKVESLKDHVEVPTMFVLTMK